MCDRSRYSSGGSRVIGDGVVFALSLRCAHPEIAQCPLLRRKYVIEDVVPIENGVSHVFLYATTDRLCSCLWWADCSGIRSCRKWHMDEHRSVWRKCQSGAFFGGQSQHLVGNRPRRSISQHQWRHLVGARLDRFAGGGVSSRDRGVHNRNTVCPLPHCKKQSLSLGQRWRPLGTDECTMHV